MIGDSKEVYFDRYCPRCKYRDDNESDVNSPCFDCLDEPANQDSHKPVNWEKREPKNPGREKR